jgi:hypothetical protein
LAPACAPPTKPSPLAKMLFAPLTGSLHDERSKPLPAWPPIYKPVQLKIAAGADATGATGTGAGATGKSADAAEQTASPVPAANTSAPMNARNPI